ncbi:Rad51B protein [Ostreococcus tauri]|uniref:Rad51B protein n=1 Tax=Ostreococcus tauri TaxID=70448 RepID=A0A1Y5I3H8_OSTTA|nr:Rad51B protein [Ostreococcus tauri]
MTSIRLSRRYDDSVNAIFFPRAGSVLSTSGRAHSAPSLRTPLKRTTSARWSPRPLDAPAPADGDASSSVAGARDSHPHAASSVARSTAQSRSRAKKISFFFGQNPSPNSLNRSTSPSSATSWCVPHSASAHSVCARNNSLALTPVALAPNSRTSTTHTVARTSTLSRRFFDRNASIIFPASPSPLGSTSTRLGRNLRIVCATAISNGDDDAQHAHPPETSRTTTRGAPAPSTTRPETSSTSAPSMPNAPKSFTMTTQSSSLGFFATISRTTVVFPAPRTPVMTFTGVLDSTTRMRPPNATAASATCSIARTRCDAIDAALRGGVRTRQITEVCGESGTGKTHLCAQLALFAQLDLGGSTVYVHTEGRAPTDVMRRMTTTRRFVEAFGGDARARGALERVYAVKSLGDADGLRETLEGVSAVLRSPIDVRAPVRLIVVDSATAPRAGTLHKMTMLLKEYASVHDLAVVVTNHVVDVVQAGECVGGLGRAYMGLDTSGRRAQPALGLMWANCVNTRLFLTRHDARGRGAVAACEGVRRRLHVVYAPHLREATVDFVLSDDGVRDAPARDDSAGVEPIPNP